MEVILAGLFPNGQYLGFSMSSNETETTFSPMQKSVGTNISTPRSIPKGTPI